MMSVKHGLRPMAAAAMMVLGAAGSASATLYGWTFTPGEPQPPGGGYVLSNAGGTFHSIFATFDTVSKELTFTLNFSDRVTRGFYLAMSAGPNPEPHPGELGLFYFDAGDVFDADASTNISLTNYGYNGANNGSSWFDGNGAIPLNQTPDLIKNRNDTAWIQSISAGDVVLPGNVMGRSFSMTVNATDIINHVPLYPDTDNPPSPWFGTGFGTHLGMWLHPFQTFDVNYDAAGAISSWETGHEGYLDGYNFRTFEVPAPGAVALAGLAGLTLVRRRRRALV